MQLRRSVADSANIASAKAIAGANAGHIDDGDACCAGHGPAAYARAGSPGHAYACQAWAMVKLALALRLDRRSGSLLGLLSAWNIHTYI